MISKYTKISLTRKISYFIDAPVCLYGPYYMSHIEYTIWPIWYRLYHMVNIIWGCCIGYYIVYNIIFIVNIIFYSQLVETYQIFYAKMREWLIKLARIGIFFLVFIIQNHLRWLYQVFYTVHHQWTVSKSGRSLIFRPSSFDLSESKDRRTVTVLFQDNLFLQILH